MASAGKPRRSAVPRQRIGSAATSEAASVVSDDDYSSSAAGPTPPADGHGPAPDLSHYDTKDSPFLDLGNPFTAWEAAKMALLLPLLLPRIALILAALVTMAAISYVAGYGWPAEQPLPRWRRAMVVAGSQCPRAMLLALGFWVRYRGWDNVEQGRREHAVVLFNHVSWVDSLVMMRMFAPSGVAKASIRGIPLVGGCVAPYQTIWVSRESISRGKPSEPTARANGSTAHSVSAAAATPDGAQTAAKDAAAALLGGDSEQRKPPSVAELLSQRAHDRRYPQLCLAPEGTCSDGRHLLRFRNGAFVPGAPVLPVVLHYRWRHLNPAWTFINLGWHAIRMMCQFVNILDVTVLPVYRPSAEEVNRPELFAANVREVYLAASGMRAAEQSQREFLALTKAGVSVSWDGRRVMAPPGVVDDEGFVDLRPYM